MTESALLRRVLVSEAGRWQASPRFAYEHPAHNDYTALVLAGE